MGALAPATAREPSEHGDRPEEFVRFYRSSVTEVYRYVLPRCGGDVSLAEDLTSEVFVAAVRAWEDDERVLTVGWLITVARNKVVDHHRRQAREERKLALVSNEAEPAAGVDQRLAYGDAVAALASLPPMQRAAAILRYLDDLPVPDVAARLNRSLHATESLLARAREGLRRASAGEGDP